MSQNNFRFKLRSLKDKENISKIYSDPSDIEKIPQLLNNINETNCSLLFNILKSISKDIYGINSSIMKTFFESSDNNISSICYTFLNSSKDLKSFYLCNGKDELIYLLEILVYSEESREISIAFSLLIKFIELYPSELDGKLPERFYNLVIEAIEKNENNISILCSLILGFKYYPNGFFDIISNLIYDIYQKNITRYVNSYDECILLIIYYINIKGYKFNTDFIFDYSKKISCELGKDINYLYLRVLNTCVDIPPHVFFPRIIDMLTSDEDEILQQTFLLITKFFNSWTFEQKELIYQTISNNIQQYHASTTMTFFGLLFNYTPYCRTNIKILNFAINYISSFSQEQNLSFLNYICNMIIQTDPSSPEYQEILHIVHDSSEIWELITGDDQTLTQVIFNLYEYVNINLKD